MPRLGLQLRELLYALAMIILGGRSVFVAWRVGSAGQTYLKFVFIYCTSAWHDPFEGLCLSL